MTFTLIKASDYLNICRFTSCEGHRLYLNGVYVDVVNKRLVATDGHRLGLLALETGVDIHTTNEPTSFILTNSKDMQRACKAGRYETVWLRCHADKVEIIKYSAMAATADDTAKYTGDVEQTFPASRVYVDGTFPDYAVVIPRNVTGQVYDTLPGIDGAAGTVLGYGLNAAYLAAFANPDEKGARIQYVPNSGGPGLVFNSDARFLGVLMPIRDRVTPADAAKRVARILGLLRDSDWTTRTSTTPSSHNGAAATTTTTN